MDIFITILGLRLRKQISRNSPNTLNVTSQFVSRPRRAQSQIGKKYLNTPGHTKRKRPWAAPASRPLLITAYQTFSTYTQTQATRIDRLTGSPLGYFQILAIGDLQRNLPERLRETEKRFSAFDSLPALLPFTYIKSLESKFIYSIRPGPMRSSPVAH